jgi:lipopolysaccharide/colanic/teichoic acid biosynthesis glycosyltransferase
LRTALKRAFDVAIAVGMAPLAVPLVLAIGALARLETPGPVIFRQTRVGRRGAAFTIYKLRTMVDNAANIGAGLYSTANDPRYTRVGIFTRRWSLDELPQLYNVFVGDMSVVGPRPVLKSTVDEYQNEYDTILQVRPGLTGLSQVNGRNLLSRRDRLKLDMHYAREWSFAMDLRILCRSIVVVLTGDGQTNSQSRADVEGEQRGS